MGDDDRIGSLIKAEDLLGLGAVGVRLIAAIERGIVGSSAAWAQRRQARATIESTRSALEVLARRGVQPQKVEVSAGDVTTIRVTAEQSRQQTNRSRIGTGAVEEVRLLAASVPLNSDDSEVLEPEWLDRFWRLAQDVSSADLQSLWSRVLARQAAGHKISARSLEALSLMSREEANLISVMATMTFYDSKTAAVIARISALPSLGRSQAFEAAMSSYVESRPHAKVLGPMGLYIEGGWAFQMDLPLGSYRVAGHRLTITEDPGKVYASGHEWSPVGRELLGLLPKATDDTFLDHVRQLLTAHKVKFEIAPLS